MFLWVYVDTLFECNWVLSVKTKKHLLIFIQVRLFHLSRLSGRGPDENAITPSALFQCHTRRVKKLAVRSHHRPYSSLEVNYLNEVVWVWELEIQVFHDGIWQLEYQSSPACFCFSYLLQVEVGNPNVVWSASEDGTLRQHDFREGASCPPAGSSHQECRNVLVSSRFLGLVGFLPQFYMLRDLVSYSEIEFF